jgi:hypothetical protein
MLQQHHDWEWVPTNLIVGSLEVVVGGKRIRLVKLKLAHQCREHSISQHVRSFRRDDANSRTSREFGYCFLCWRPMIHWQTHFSSPIVRKQWELCNWLPRDSGIWWSGFCFPRGFTHLQTVDSGFWTVRAIMSRLKQRWLSRKISTCASLLVSDLKTAECIKSNTSYFYGSSGVLDPDRSPSGASWVRERRWEVTVVYPRKSPDALYRECGDTVLLM